MNFAGSYDIHKSEVKFSKTIPYFFFFQTLSYVTHNYIDNQHL